ncbi:MAG: hypothetical protein MI741_12540 [Rhodospirillales bacterium]|nr:hypothetical protein [Rhodospirillales bacterium]
MPRLGEILQALYGAYRLARFDANGMRFFDDSISGFWKSFFAAVIIAPLFFFLLSMRFQHEAAELSAFRYFSVEVIAYVIRWVAFPLIMISIAKVLDRDEKYLGFIVAYNWASVLQSGVFLTAAILALSGAIPAAAGGILSLLILAAIIIYAWFVTKTALDLPGGTAAAIVGFEFFLGIAIDLMAESLL